MGITGSPASKDIKPISAKRRCILARLYPKLRTRFSLSGKNPGFLANTFPPHRLSAKLNHPLRENYAESITAIAPKSNRVKSD